MDTADHFELETRTRENNGHDHDGYEHQRTTADNTKRHQRRTDEDGYDENEDHVDANDSCMLCPPRHCRLPCGT